MPWKGSEKTLRKVSDKSGQCGVAAEHMCQKKRLNSVVLRLPCGPGLKDQDVSFKLNN